MKNRVKTLDIYFSDLPKDKQEILLQMAEVKDPEDMNWDSEPVFTINRRDLAADYSNLPDPWDE